MNVGDLIKFQFAGKEREGTVVRVFSKTVYLKVDFPHHPGKIVMRKLTELEGKTAPQKKKAKKERAKKEKMARAKQKITEEKKEGEGEAKKE